MEILKYTECINVPAQQNLVYCYNVGEGVNEDELEAMRWYREVAEQGHSKTKSGLIRMEHQFYFFKLISLKDIFQPIYRGRKWAKGIYIIYNCKWFVV